MQRLRDGTPVEALDVGEEWRCGLVARSTRNKHLCDEREGDDRPQLHDCELATEPTAPSTTPFSDVRFDRLHIGKLLLSPSGGRIVS